MRKMMLAAVLFCFATGSALPAMAVEVDFSGSFEVEGILNSSEKMDKDDKTSDFRQMRLRVKTDFTITDDLKLTTRFDALEKVLSSKDSAFDNGVNDTGIDGDTDDDNIDFDRAYLTWKSPIGLFQVGRMEGVTWGTTWCDDEDDTDRIKYILPIPLGEGTFYIGAVAEKVTENDKGTELSDEDNDKYYIGLTYKAKNYTTGLLNAFYNFKKFQDPGQALATKEVMAFKSTAESSLVNYNTYSAQATALSAAGDLAGAAAAQQAAAAALTSFATNGAAAQAAIPQRGLTCEGQVVLLAPYFEGKFGDFEITAELDYVFGTTEYDTPGAKDRDLKSFAYFFEGGYDFGPGTVQLGFAHVKGDADYTDDDIESMGYVSPGADWEKMFILNDDSHGMNTTLANVGNHIGDGFGSASIAMLDGYQMLYAGVDYDVTDTINLGFMAAISKADDVPSGLDYDDDQGVEYDLSFTWNLTKNLEYKAIAAYLDGGDYWKSRGYNGVVNPDIDPDIYTLYHKLTLTF